MDEYQGWYNRQTWTINLWINNDEQLQDAAMQCQDAKALQDMMEDELDVLSNGIAFGANFMSDLLAYDFAICDWQSIYDGLHEE